MRTLLFFWYLLVVLLDYGNKYYSDSVHRPIDAASKPVMDLEGAFALWNTAMIVGLEEDVFPDLIEENSTEGNEDDNSGKDFSQKNPIHNKYLFNYPDLGFEHYFVAHQFTSSRFAEHHPVPIYLTNRVLRI